MTESPRTADCSPPPSADEGSTWRGFCKSSGGGPPELGSCELILAELDRLSLLVRFGGKEGTKSRLHLSDVVSVELFEDGGMEIVAYELRGGKRWRDCYRFANYSSASILPFATRLKAALTTTNGVKPWPHRPSHNEYNEERPRVLVLANPASGQGRALDLWREHAQPIFADLHKAGVPYELDMTFWSGHATRRAMNLDLDRYCAVAIVSGDGLVAEWIYGLLQRSDHLRALKLPILHIPGGTSNGLAAAVAYQCNEPFPPRGVFYRQMTLMLASARARRFRALRLHHVEIAPAPAASDGEEKDRGFIHRPMFMSMSWGLFADVDICSERFRWAGMIRLHMEAFLRLVRLPSVAKYKGRISYIPVTDKETLRRTRLKLQSSRIAFGKHHFDGEDVKEWSSDSTTTSSPQVTIEETFRNQHVVEAPSLAEPVPPNWETLEGEFVYVCLISLSHIGSDLPYHPGAKLEEEVFYLSFVDWRTLKSRLHMAHLMISIDRCSHLDQPCLQVVPVLACRVEPAEGAGGYVALDGEVVCPAGSSFQVVSSKLKATVVAREASASESIDDEPKE